ncbi:MAG: hypothetical protein KKF44_04465 [Nanoarchaeota archaeon]|nr:hypothetical protein [Nanoarchaeota archaeon]
MKDMDELKNQKRILKKKILTLEWDKNLHQLNFAKNKILDRYRKEYDEVKAKMDGETIPSDQLVESSSQ